MPGKPSANHLYTVVLEFSGTTSVSQVRAASIQGAMSQWINKLSESDAYGLSEEAACQLHEALEAQEGIGVLVPIEGLHSVWCVSALAGGELAVLNLIETRAKRRIKDRPTSHNRV